MITLADRVKETSTTTGTGTLNLAGAVSGFVTFVAGAGDGAEVDYVIQGGAEWEVGTGTVTDATPDTLSRTTVHASSNSGSLVNLSAGTKNVFLTIPAVRPVVNLEVFDPSAAASVDIDIAGYEAVRLVGNVSPATDDAQLYLRTSADGGSTFDAGASDYRWYRQYALAAATGGDGDDADTGIQIAWCGNEANENLGFDLMIVCPAESGRRTSVHSNAFLTQSDGTGGAMIVAGSRLAAEVNDAVQLIFSAGNIASGHIAVYGYRAV